MTEKSMSIVKRSQKEYPLADLDLAGTLSKAWNEGWMDEYSDNHFLIKAIEGRLENNQAYYNFDSYYDPFYGVNKDNFQENFCINLSHTILGFMHFFGERKIRTFFTDQLSAGKEKYDEAQFFRALSEISVLRFWIQRSKSGEYEPKINGKKNPEARFYCNNGVTVGIEVKTPGFRDFDGIYEFAIPLVLLENEGRVKFTSYCSDHSLNGLMPRVSKLKDFLNSAAEKFETVDHINHMNILYINWTFSEVIESGYEEALSLLANPENGILIHKDIGLKLGINEDVYDKITAVIVYTESVGGLMFGDFRYVWIRRSNGMPDFGIVPLHNGGDLFKTTGMNPDEINSKGTKPFPIIYYQAKDANCFDDLCQIVCENILLSKDDDLLSRNET